MNESKPRIDSELARLAERRRELLERLAPILFDVSSASPNRQKLLRERRKRRKAIRDLIREVESSIVTRVMELTEESKHDSATS
jgi:DnaJ-domain-containing protein 1